MPAEFVVKSSDLKVILRELNDVDPNLRRKLQQEMRTDLKPFVQKLKGGIPKDSPLSGFARASADSRFRWSSVNASVRTPLGGKARKPGFYPVVTMKFRSRNKAAGFEIAELAGSRSQGQTPQGRAMIAQLNRVAPIIGGLGRYVIPEGKKESREATKVAVKIIEKYVAMVNRRIR